MGGSSYSVFVGNVPYDATEERLKDMFSEVGPVTSFRCVSEGSARCLVDALTSFVHLSFSADRR